MRLHRLHGQDVGERHEVTRRGGFEASERRREPRRGCGKAAVECENHTAGRMRGGLGNQLGLERVKCGSLNGDGSRLCRRCQPGRKRGVDHDALNVTERDERGVGVAHGIRVDQQVGVAGIR